jgi:hypothetical protein
MVSLNVREIVVPLGGALIIDLALLGIVVLMAWEHKRGNYLTVEVDWVAYTLLSILFPLLAVAYIVGRIFGWIPQVQAY